MQPASTIYIRMDLKERLQQLKRHPKESYNIVLERLLSGDSGALDGDEMRGFEGSFDDIRPLRPLCEEADLPDFDDNQ